MNVAPILASVATHISLTPAEEQYFTSLLQPHTLPKKTLLLREGTVCRHFAFVSAGCLKSFLYNKAGGEYILTFAPANWWVADITSLLHQTPSSLYIEAIEHSEVLLLSRANQLALYQRVPAFERLFRILLENAFAASQERMIDTMSLPTELRFRKFCQRYPDLQNRLPHKQLAAYLGVTPEFFSRMRRKMAATSAKNETF